MSDQRRQSLDYFRAFASEWRKKANGDCATAVNVIEQRNGFVLSVVGERERTARALDLGCGTGDLCCELARQNIDAVGVDFAPEMIALCNEKKASEGVHLASFVCASIFDYHPGDVRFDIISANGLIEYISLEELDRFLGFVRDHLAPGGSFVVGTRNRLFNAFSLNEYTRLERAAGAFDGLVDEALAICATDSMAACIASLSARCVGQAAPLASHPWTGIDVATRHQFTPTELLQRLARVGLRVVELFPIHYHGMIPAFAVQHPELHVTVSTLVQGHARGAHRLIPFSSSYMLHAFS